MSFEIGITLTVIALTLIGGLLSSTLLTLLVLPTINMAIENVVHWGEAIWHGRDEAPPAPEETLADLPDAQPAIGGG